MDTTWEKDGILFGTMTEKIYAQGGQWNVGDRFKPDEPGYSEVVKYKSWAARPDKYRAGAYSFKDRTDSGEWEYVVAMRGELIAIEDIPGTDKITQHGLDLDPSEFVEFPPKSLRSWKLLSDKEEAYGGTILWSGEGMRTGAWLGNQNRNGFCFRKWYYFDDLSLSPAELELQVMYIEVFNGSLTYSIGGSQKALLNAGSFMYIKTGVKFSLQCKTDDTRGVVLYYR